MDPIQDNSVRYARQNKYYLKNKETILQKQKQPVKCEICGTTVNRSNLTRHQTSMKCLAHVFIEFDNPDSDKVFLLKDL